jgi:NADH-quinone oxidoreductase subunit E
LDNQQFLKRLASLPRQRTQALPAVLLAQQVHGWVPDDAIQEIASHLRLTINDVESIVTSYPELNRHPLREIVARVCNGLSCWTHGSDDVLAELEAQLGVSTRESTTRRRVSLETTPCCFACAVAPVVEINGDLHGRVKRERIASLIQAAIDQRNGE